MLDDRDPAACGFVTRSAREVLDGTSVSGPPTWACICACECGVEERGTKPRPLLDVEVHAWRSMVFVIEERFLRWRLNGRRTLTFTAGFIRTGVRGERTWTHPSLAHTMSSIRPSSCCRSTSKTRVSSGDKKLEYTQSSKP